MGPLAATIEAGTKGLAATIGAGTRGLVAAIEAGTRGLVVPIVAATSRRPTAARIAADVKPRQIADQPRRSVRAKAARGLTRESATRSRHAPTRREGELVGRAPQLHAVAAPAAVVVAVAAVAVVVAVAGAAVAVVVGAAVAAADADAASIGIGMTRMERIAIQDRSR